MGSMELLIANVAKGQRSVAKKGNLKLFNIYVTKFHVTMNAPKFAAATSLRRPAKKAIVDFVTKVTTKGPDFVPAPERVATLAARRGFDPILPLLLLAAGAGVARRRISKSYR